MGQWKSELHGNDDKLPTLSQWIKTVSSEAILATRLVKLIWTPNLYDNYSLDTEVYRFRISPNHALFNVLEEELENWLENMTVLALQLEGTKKPSITLLTLDNEVGEWSALGDHGWKIGQVEAKPKKTSSAKTRTKSATLPTPPQDALQDVTDLLG